MAHRPALMQNAMSRAAVAWARTVSPARPVPPLSARSAEGSMVVSFHRQVLNCPSVFGRSAVSQVVRRNPNSDGSRGVLYPTSAASTAFAPLILWGRIAVSVGDSPRKESRPDSRRGAGSGPGGRHHRPGHWPDAAVIRECAGNPTANARAKPKSFLRWRAPLAE